MLIPEMISLIQNDAKKTGVRYFSG